VPEPASVFASQRQDSLSLESAPGHTAG